MQVMYTCYTLGLNEYDARPDMSYMQLRVQNVIPIWKYHVKQVAYF